MHAEVLLQDLWHQAAGDPAALSHLRFTGSANNLPSHYQVGALAAATIAAQALAAGELWHIRGGRRQAISVNRRHALAMFRSERFLLIDDLPPADPWSPLSGYYRAAGAGWIQLHTNFPAHRDGVLHILQCADERSAVAAAIRQWDAAALEARLAEAGLCAAMIRSPAQWQAHPQATALATLPLFDVVRIGDAPPELPGQRSGMSTASMNRPLDGVRVLDLSRVIAAPVAARTLAQHGADVLAVGAAHLPNIPLLVVDTGRGKRSTLLDLRQPVQQATLQALVRDADVYLQAYRPATLEARGFTPQALCALRPGLIQVSLSAYGHAGPWAARRGFDSLVQSATGIAWLEGQATGLDGPGKLPCQALDHATGYLAAMGTMIALQRRAREGGSWLVRVSLAQTGRWLQSLGPATGTARELSEQEVAPWRERTASAFGLISAIAPVEQMAESPAVLATPPVPLGTHAPAWISSGR